MTGTISKISGSAQVTYQGKTYKVSQYSSKNAQNFIEAMSTSSSVSITFSGGFKDSEVVLESVR